MSEGRSFRKLTCCCHICKTSLNQYKREYLGCSQCNKIVCKNCFGTKFKAATWEESKRHTSWLCPSCSGTCVCPRCRKRQGSPSFSSIKISPVGSEEFKSSAESSPTRERHGGEKIKFKVEKVVYGQLQDMIDREKRCDVNIKEMERLLYIMRREKEDISDERSKLENMLSFAHRKKLDSVFSYSSRWNQLLMIPPSSSKDSGSSSSDQDDDLDDQYEDINVVA